MCAQRSELRLSSICMGKHWASAFRTTSYVTSRCTPRYHAITFECGTSLFRSWVFEHGRQTKNFPYQRDHTVVENGIESKWYTSTRFSAMEHARCPWFLEGRGGSFPRAKQNPCRRTVASYEFCSRSTILS